MSEERFDRIEVKLDKLIEAVTTQGVEGKAVQNRLSVVESTTSKLKTKQDKQDGATAFVGFLALSGILAVIATEIMRHLK